MTADTNNDKKSGAPMEPGAPTPEDIAGETGPAVEPLTEAVALEDDRTAQLEGEVAVLKDQVLRAMAETENVRRRAEREREDTAKFAVSKFAKEMLAVADNLRRALEAVPADARAANETLNTVLVGVEATERQLGAAFDRFGIKKVEALGQPFDPNKHQVMFEVENTGKPAGTIVQVLQDGYLIHDRLLREALVGVAKGDGGNGSGHVDTKA